MLNDAIRCVIKGKVNMLTLVMLIGVMLTVFVLSDVIPSGIMLSDISLITHYDI